MTTKKDSAEIISIELFCEIKGINNKEMGIIGIDFTNNKVTPYTNSSLLEAESLSVNKLMLKAKIWALRKGYRISATLIPFDENNYCGFATPRRVNTVNGFSTDNPTHKEEYQAIFSVCQIIFLELQLQRIKKLKENTQTSRQINSIIREIREN